MAPKEYKNAERVSLFDFIEIARFRTVLHEQYDEPHGISEIPVEIEMKNKFAKTLSFHVPWDCLLYGFVRQNEKLKAINQAEGEKAIKLVSLHDWDKNFLMLIETKSGDKAFFVESEDVKKLLEGCMRPREQRTENK